MAFSYRFSTLLLLLTLPACEPKDDGSDDTGATEATGDAGTTTGEVTTSGDASDPTSPSTDPSASGTTATATGSGGTSATSTSTSGPSTTGGDPTVATTGEDTGGSGMTTVATSTSTTGETDSSDTDLPPPVEPPLPCEGQAMPLVGITTSMGYLQSQVPPRQDPTGGSSTASGGGDLDPGTLFVKLSDQNFTCADPNALLACGEHWEVTIVIPPEFQSPGVHNLLGQNVRGVAGETGPDEGGNECAFGGGSFGATFEILAIDDKVVEGRLCNVESFFSFANPQLEGTFTADRCPQ